MILTEVEGVPPEGARTITLLSIGDDALSVENEVGGTMIKSRSLLAVSAENSSKFVILYFVMII